jgi:hypothetical protein
MHEIVSAFDKKVSSLGIGGLAAFLLLGGAGCLGEGEDSDFAVVKSADDNDIVEVTSAIIGPSGHDYRFFTTATNWFNAQQTCASLAPAGSYHLVTITSAAEDAWLLNEERIRGGQWWIGYNDRGSEGLWRWDRSIPNGYVNWHAGEPNNQGDEDCGHHNGFTDGKWNDSNCNNSFRFTCENGTDTQQTQLSWNQLSNTNSATTNYLQFAIDIPFNTGATIGTCTFGIGDTYLRLMSPSGVQVAENDDFPCGQNGRQAQISAGGAVNPNGTYVIRAGCYQNSTCDGTVEIQR